MTDARAFRLLVRSGHHNVHTTGLANGMLQANIVILPESLADAFTLYCQRNPKPCPLIARSEPGDYLLDTLGVDLDIRTDVPKYRVFRDGELSEEPHDIRALWQNNFVTFAIGCSFSFEEALAADGLEPRHIGLGRNVSMYRTSIATIPAGPFRAPWL
jgi:uncharacterized protein YcsI (UPF0317 family)